MDIISTYSILPLVSSILIFILGLFVWLKKPTEWLHIVFFVYLLILSIWLFGTFKLFNAQTEDQQLFWDRFIYIGIVFVPIFLYHFGIIYCGIGNRQNYLLIIGYLTAFVFLPISQLSDNFVSGLYKYSWGVHAVAKTYHNYFLVYFSVYLVLFFVNLGIHYKNSQGIHKTQVKYILIGYSILYMVGPLAFLPAYGIPVYPIIFLSAVPFAGLMSYAIIKFNALDVKTITTEVIVSFLNVLAVGQIFFSRNSTELVLRVFFGFLLFVFSIILVRSVRKEIERREEVTKLAQSLEKANIRLQELDKQKTDFLSIAAHQLRTPLSIFNGYLELLQDNAYGKITKETKEILGNMDESNGHLVKLVDSFLDITRLEQGRTKYDFKETNLNSVIKDVVKELNNRAEQKGLKIKMELIPDLPLAVIDEEKIRHVVFNFIDNAIKYSETGEIRVQAHKEKDGLALRVKDNGLGFNKIDEASFFQKFYRGNNVNGVNVNGTGLGLYVCRMFVEAHKGKVWAHSEGLGKGSEFGFWVPLVNSMTPSNHALTYTA